MTHDSPRFPMLTQSRTLFACLLMALAVPACGGSQSGGNVEYSVSATQNYAKGLERLKKKDWVAAAKYLSFIKARFPYSRFAVLAELRLADAEFGAGHYLQAIDGYKQYIKFHPTNEMVVNGYAPFKIGECYFHMLPDDWWMLPPTFEKDQSATTDAHRELTAFLKKYPDSGYRKDAKAMITKINRRLAEHEMYVAQFYWKNNRPMGTVLRLRRLLERHGGVGLDGEALYLLGKAYMKVKMPERAKKAWERLLREHPKHENAGETRDRLRELG